jgi:hypothetical protein
MGRDRSRNRIVNGLSRSSRIVLSSFSAVCGVVMVVVAPPTNQAPAFYLIALICLLLCIACIGHTKVRQILGSCAGTILFAGSLWYGYASFAQPAFFNALVLFVVFGLPGAAYAVVKRFGFRSISEDAWAGADNPNRLQQPIPFYNREPWNLVIGFTAAFAVAISIALATSPWIFLVPLVAWAIVSIRRYFRRKWALRDRGYFGHRHGPNHWVYEERHGYSLAALILPLENTEPGHWELFIPDDAKWRATVPDWARDRRGEIALRIAEAWKLRDFHLPNDLKGPDASG